MYLANASVINIIQNSVHSHAYLRDVNAICEVVVHRLSTRGIYLRDMKDCTHAPINSTLASTLDELYHQFEKTDINHLKTEYYLQRKKHIDCQRKCPVELLFDGPIEYWVYDHIPNVQFDDCWPKCNFNVTIGALDINELAYEPCLQCLGEADSAVRNYNKFRVGFIQFESTLSREIALVWRHQMPKILQEKSKSAILKY